MTFRICATGFEIRTSTTFDAVLERVVCLVNRPEGLADRPTSAAFSEAKTAPGHLPQVTSGENSLWNVRSKWCQLTLMDVHSKPGSLSEPSSTKR